MPKSAKNENRHDLPGDNWVEFEGTRTLGQLNILTKADRRGDFQKVAELLAPIIKAWSFDGDPQTFPEPDEDDPYADTLGAWSQLELEHYKALAQTAMRHLTRDDSGN